MIIIEERNNEKAEKLAEVLKKLRCYFFAEHPFWGTILSCMKFVVSSEFPVAATDCHSRIVINPACVEFNKEDLKFVVLHELLHTIFLHSQRRGRRDYRLWNVACDYAVNSVLIDEMGMNTSLEKLYDPRFKKKSAEEIYEILKDEIQSQSGDKTNPSGVEVSDSDGEKNTCVGGSSDREKQGKLFPDDLIPSNNPREESEKTKDLIVQAHTVYEKMKHKFRGDLPSSVVKVIKKIIEPRIPFERLLARYVSEFVTGKGEYSYSPVNKKAAFLFDIVLPSINKEESQKVVVAVDTSGSISESELSLFAGAIKKLSTLTQELTVITCDCKIQQVVRTSEIESFLKKLDFKGRGGTSHIPVFEYIDKNIRNPDVVVCLTDGYTEYPEKKPKYPVIWVLTRDHKEPPWGLKVVLEEDVYEDI